MYIELLRHIINVKSFHQAFESCLKLILLSYHIALQIFKPLSLCDKEISLIPKSIASTASTTATSKRPGPSPN